jgi:hypothetical protein
MIISEYVGSGHVSPPPCKIGDIKYVKTAIIDE